MGTRSTDQDWIDDTDLPDNRELLGYQGSAMRTLPVAVNGPVQTQAMPSQGGTTIQRKITTVADRILNEDPRRSRVIILAHDDDVLIGFDQASVSAGTAALWPKLVPLTITCTSQVWVAAASTTTVVSAIPEQWTH